MASMPCHAGGTSKRIACIGSSPPISSTSSILSRLCESDPVVATSGWISDRSGSSGERNTGPRATAQLRLPWIVLISPLCAR
jgi:hypothetical protein